MTKKMGVYQIRCTVTDESYIGSTKNFKHRFSQHQSKLRHKKHPNINLQNAYKEHGEDNFIYEVLETVKNKDDLLKREQYYLDTLSPEYNIADNAEFSMLGRKLSDESKKKISEAVSGENHPFYGKHLSKEHRKNLSKAHMGKEGMKGEKNPMYGKPLSKEHKKKLSIALSGEKNPMYGKHISEEQKEILRKVHTGKTMSKESRLKMSKSRSGEKNHMYGKNHKKESKEKMSKTRKEKGVAKGVNNPKAKLTPEDVKEIRRLNKETDLYYYEIGEKFNVTGSLVGQIVRGQCWTHI